MNNTIEKFKVFTAKAADNKLLALDIFSTLGEAFETVYMLDSDYQGNARIWTNEVSLSSMLASLHAMRGIGYDYKIEGYYLDGKNLRTTYDFWGTGSGFKMAIIYSVAEEDVEAAVETLGGGNCTIETVEHKEKDYTQAGYTERKVVCNL